MLRLKCFSQNQYLLICSLSMKCSAREVVRALTSDIWIQIMTTWLWAIHLNRTCTVVSKTCWLSSKVFMKLYPNLALQVKTVSHTISKKASTGFRDAWIGPSELMGYKACVYSHGEASSLSLEKYKEKGGFTDHRHFSGHLPWLEQVRKIQFAHYHYDFPW